MRALQTNVNALKLGGKASKETIFLVVAWAVSGMLLVNQALYLTAMPGATILTQKIMRTFSKPLAKTVQPKPARHQRMRYVPELHLILVSFGTRVEQSGTCSEHVRYVQTGV